MRKALSGSLPFLFALVLALAFSLTGCAQTTTSTTPSEPKETEKQTQPKEATTEEEAPPSEEQPLDGKTLVEERCGVCHTLERVQAAKQDRAGWEATVDEMIVKGARLSETERSAVIDYLSSQ